MGTMGLKMNNLLLFDFDGVLANTMDDIIRNTQAAAVSVGTACTVTKDIVRDATRMEFEELAKKIGIPADRVDLFVRETLRLFAEQKTIPAAYPDIDTVLLQLSQKNTICIITGNSESMVKRFLAQYAVEKTVSAVFDKDYPGNKTDKILHSMKKYNKTVSETYMIGDASSDIDAAHSASVKSIAAAWGNQNPDILSASKPDYMLYQPKELLDILNG